MLFKENFKYFIGPFLFIFFLSLIVVNWNEIGWFLNYRAIKEVVQSQFPSSSIIEPRFLLTEEKNKISIPSLNLEAPLIYLETEDKDIIHESLDEGVVHYPSSSLPGERGNVVILGHSAPSGWPDINYDRVFSHIDQLKEGELIYVYFDNYIYPYNVFAKHIFSLDENEAYLSLPTEEFMLILSTCYPPGKNEKRYVVMARLVFEHDKEVLPLTN
jgi:LPXTG-site transpeptidase (sortase) family protein